ncbi:winged helix-turn-helix transcriptional regulator [Rhizobium jaguaris]|uniref:Transcriptional regulator n=1 Tax=Rhizobium jaguaris TaxID=1312183 RepID=A0A387FR64_9HYPH|nr:winged helix-turn-helix transcriptional regulator [Rhizobium jaguaris]AYG58554.1 transcriptional regulator [Rhizobium jaguaris]
MENTVPHIGRSRSEEAKSQVAPMVNAIMSQVFFYWAAKACALQQSLLQKCQKQFGRGHVPRVDYALTPLGASLEPIIKAIAVWGEENVFCDSGKQEVRPLPASCAPAVALKSN